MKHIVSFSGGKDSTAMLLMMLERGMQVDEIIYCNVMATPNLCGDFPEMYEYIRRIEGKSPLSRRKYLLRNNSIRNISAGSGRGRFTGSHLPRDFPGAMTG